MDKITKKVLDRIEKEYRTDTKQNVIGHGLYTIDRIRREIIEEKNLTKHNNNLKKDCSQCDNGKKIIISTKQQYCGFCGRKLPILR